jgi:hypothetical protein
VKPVAHPARKIATPVNTSTLTATGALSVNTAVAALVVNIPMIMTLPHAPVVLWDTFNRILDAVPAKLAKVVGTAPPQVGHTAAQLVIEASTVQGRLHASVVVKVNISHVKDEILASAVRLESLALSSAKRHPQRATIALQASFRQLMTTDPHV